MSIWALRSKFSQDYQAAPQPNRCLQSAALRLLLVCIGTGLLAGCGSLFREGSSVAAGIGGAALASKVTDNAAVATGIGLGVQAVVRAGVQYVEKSYHRQQQDLIAGIAGRLGVGQVATWRIAHAIPLEPDEQGRVTVSRVISAGPLQCKEIVFSVDSAGNRGAESAFYIATVCQDRTVWRWASAEPATERWGSLQ